MLLCHAAAQIPELVLQLEDCSAPLLKFIKDALTPDEADAIVEVIDEVVTEDTAWYGESHRYLMYCVIDIRSLSPACFRTQVQERNHDAYSRVLCHQAWHQRPPGCGSQA